ncbi:MAG: SDR family NAD(P)-dependent oxidoreductase [Gammaproteobacteria bacterium]|nr:SDR family NAD(P)-dependent oxidoreductase [Gammaproteobacteria bacterium]
MSDLSGKTALITGGSMGLGKAMATEFYKANGNVALVARRQDQLDNAKAEIEQSASSTGKVHIQSCDVTDADQIIEAHRASVAGLGEIDILVNNAGKSEAHPFMSVTDEIWKGDLELKLFAAIRLTRLVFPGMCERKWGRIINILNTAAKTPGARSAPTSVSRAAGMALTKVLAGEGAPHNVLVNALLIGRIESDQSRRAYDTVDREESYEEYLARSGAGLPMGRMGVASECGSVAGFLVSEGASYLTGCAINMDGGVSPVV